MPYASGRIYHDADSHIMELPDFLRDHAEARFRDRLPRLGISAIGEDPNELIDWAQRTCPLHLDDGYRAEEDQVTLRKNYFAVGSFERDHRSEALDQLGFASQLVFNTFTSSELVNAEHGADVELAYAMADAHNRGMVHFCDADRRLLPVGYVALMDIGRAGDQAGRAIEAGCKALMIASYCPEAHSPSHIGLDRVWAQAEEAQVPVVMHVGGGGTLLSPKYFVNGLPIPLDFHGGAENFRSVDYMAIPYNPMQTMAALILDGVLERFPQLQWGIIEQGASWLPGWMRYLDSAFDAFRKNEERLQKLSLRPSEYVKRQVKATPYPGEDTGWIISQSGPAVCLFSSDYPHVEGGRNPLKRFGSTLEGASEVEVDAFYSGNMADLMGPHLPALEPA
ncbi:MAG: amidohydrolase family protein [Acidimicrobiia bacterium]|nr:amidohydrolase family protein [Acidimicrobiia bacterium]